MKEKILNLFTEEVIEIKINDNIKIEDGNKIENSYKKINKIINFTILPLVIIGIISTFINMTYILIDLYSIVFLINLYLTFKSMLNYNYILKMDNNDIPITKNTISVLKKWLILVLIVSILSTYAIIYSVYIIVITKYIYDIANLLFSLFILLFNIATIYSSFKKVLKRVETLQKEMDEVI